jgi:polyisoprenoid-binding protein YceI
LLYRNGASSDVKVPLHHKIILEMKKLTIVLSAFFLLTAFTTLTSVWKNDDPHSQLGFTVTHLGISDISGTFNDFDVIVNSSKPDFSDAQFELIAKTASIDTRVEARNNHLKSADFSTRKRILH